MTKYIPPMTIIENQIAACEAADEELQELYELGQRKMKRMSKENAAKFAQKLTERGRASLALQTIKPQFPVCPEGLLMYAVVDCAVRDLFSQYPGTRTEAARYLKGDMYAASSAGVSAIWIREILARTHVYLDARQVVKPLTL